MEALGQGKVGTFSNYDSTLGDEHAGSGEVPSNENALLTAVSRATCELLNSEQLISGLPTALKLIGEAAKMDRLLVLLETEVNDQLVHRVFHEWVAPGITTHASAGLADQSNDDFPELMRRLRAGRSFWIRVSELQGRGRENFERLGIRTTTGFPIFVGGRYSGLLAFDDCHRERLYDRDLEESLKAVAEVIAAAMRRELQIESAARDRLTELNKSSTALQASIDALGDSENLDEFVPEVLDIVARTFGVSSCSLFESSPSGKIWLRYWNVDGKTYLPLELAQLDVEKYSLVRMLAGGFEVPDSYLGEPAAHKFGPVVIDHVAGTSVPEFDRFAIGAGWDLELNIGVAARGARACTLCVYRERAYPFTESEIALAEALAKQLGLAMETIRLAEEVRLAAVARERELAADSSALKLAKANAAMRSTLAAMTAEQTLDEFLGVVLRAITEHLDSPGADLWLYEPSKNRINFYLGYVDGQAVRDPGPVGDYPFRRNYPFRAVETAQILRGDHRFEEDFLEIVRSLGGDAIYWYLGKGVKGVMRIPVAVGSQVIGNVAIWKRDTSPFDEDQVELAISLTHQAALSIHASRLAEKAREAAVACEREEAALQRAAELAHANEALRRGVERVAQSDSLDGLLEGLLLGSMSVTGAAGGAIALWRDGRFAGYQCIAEDDAIVPTEKWNTEPFFQEVPEMLQRDPDGLTSRLLAAPYTRETVEWARQSWPAFAEYHDSRGHVEVWNIPCISRGIVLASLGLAFREPRDGSPVLVETLTALAQQMALGLEMARRAEQQKTEALAREREASAARERLEAARSRADELAKAHDVLRQSSEGLATLEDLGGFLEQITRSAVAASGGAGGGIGLLDAEENSLRIVVSVDDSGPDGAITQTYPQPAAIPLDGPAQAAWAQIAASEGYWWTNPEDPGFTDEFRQYHQARGHRQVAHIRMAIRAKTVGFLCIAFREEEKPNAPRLEILRVLALQASLAVALSRLAEKARDAAVARDRELQAKRTNEFLVQTATALSSGNDLTAALRSVVEQLALAIDAAHVFLFRHKSDEHTLQLQLSYLEGRIRWGSSGDELPLWASPFRDDVAPAWGILRDQRGLFTPENTPIPAEEFGWPGCFEYANKFEVSDLAHIILFAGDSPLGSLGFGFRGGRKLRSADRHLIELAAQQATIIIRMLDLSEEAQIGAIALEREIASERRTADLTKTNDALRRTLDAVAFEPALDDVLDKVLSAIAEQLGCNSCALWMVESNGATFKARLLLDEGRVLKNGLDFDRCLKRVWGGGRTLLLQQHIDEKKPVVYQTRELAEHHPKAGVFLESLGVHTLLGVPLILGGEIIGSLTARFHTPRVLSAEELELSQVMSHQATLAIQLTRMAEKAGEAALSEERARFAREIHDTLAQGFTGILMQLGAASQVPGALRSEIAPQLDAVTSLARSSLAEARRSVRAFRPLPVSECRLDRTVEQLIERVRVQTKADVVFRLTGSRGQIAPHVENELCRIVQESLNNAVKHSVSKRITVSVEFGEPNTVRLSVKDDGVGFDPSSQPHEDSFGLIGMQERAASIGASLTIISERTRGTEIIVQFGKGEA